MKYTIINDILRILNCDLEPTKKQNCLYKMRKDRRGDNRKLLTVVAQMLSSHILPLKIEEPIRGNFCEISERNYEALKRIVNNSNCIYFNAVCSEIIWIHTHDISFAQKAIFLYQKQLEKTEFDADTEYTELIVSICRIYSKCQVANFSFDSFFQNSVDCVKNNYDVDNFCILFILDSLSVCNKNFDILEKVYEEAISYYEQNYNFRKAIEFLESLQKLYNINKRTMKKQAASNYLYKKNDIIVRIAKNYEKQAEQYDWNSPYNAQQIIMLIQRAMEEWNKTEGEQKKLERERLAKRIEPVKKLSLKAMQRFTSKGIDISGWVKEIRKFIEKAKFEEVIYRIAETVPLKGYDDMDKADRSGFFSSLFPLTVLDGNGRKRCIVPSRLRATKNEKISIYEHDASEEYSIMAEVFIEKYLVFAKEKFEFTDKNLEFLVEDNIFVQEDRKKSILNGIVAGFNMDMVTAMHLLMPQVENAIRYLAQECGAVVYKTKEGGIEESLSLKSILNLPQVVDCFDEVFLFNLRLFYTSDYGFGMRNAVCHGLYSDKELNSYRSLAVWWFTLHICCMYSSKLHERMYEILKEKDN